MRRGDPELLLVVGVGVEGGCAPSPHPKEDGQEAGGGQRGAQVKFAHYAILPPSGLAWMVGMILILSRRLRMLTKDFSRCSEVVLPSIILGSPRTTSN